MAKTNEDIFQAVQGLDPGNDEHWTADGLPRLDAVENLLGASTSRKAVTNAAPEYTRDHAQSVLDAEHDKAAEPVDNDNDAEALSPEPAEQTDEVTADNDEDDDTDPLAEGPADLEAEMDTEILAAQERISAIRQSLEEGRRVLAETEEELGKLVNAKNQAFPPMTQAEAIQRFQRNELAKRAAARSTSGPSPLDAAMKAARKPRRQGQQS